MVGGQGGQQWDRWRVPWDSPQYVGRPVQWQSNLTSHSPCDVIEFSTKDRDREIVWRKSIVSTSRLLSYRTLFLCNDAELFYYVLRQLVCPPGYCILPISGKRQLYTDRYVSYPVLLSFCNLAVRIKSVESSLGKPQVLPSSPQHEPSCSSFSSSSSSSWSNQQTQIWTQFDQQRIYSEMKRPVQPSNELKHYRWLVELLD